MVVGWGWGGGEEGVGFECVGHSGVFGAWCSGEVCEGWWGWRSEQKEEEETLGTFGGHNLAEIWFLMAGLEVNVYVEGEYEKGRKGVAAVLVYGKLYTAVACFY